MCGEQSGCAGGVAACGGSPPRVRGTGYNYISINSVERITPACAGNRRIPRRPPPGSRDHPRVCGEQFKLDEYRKLGKGSPPRVRGTAASNCLHLHSNRITPACAGNSDFLELLRLTGEDHPRVCGEQSKAPKVFPARAGSPPRVRGTGPCSPCGPVSPGITPACAGNSGRIRKTFE